jgi:hypothetical protein
MLTFAGAWAHYPKPESILQEVQVDGTYDHPLFFWNKASSVDTDELTMSVLIATILFNLGLLCHQMGTMYGN